MRIITTRIRMRRSAAAVVVGLALIAAGTPAASAVTGQPIQAAPVTGPIESGSSSGSGYLLNAVLNLICALTGEKPTCWGDVPS